MAQPLITVVTIVLNDLEGLKRTEASVRSQDFQSFEWVIIDGGSSDGAAAYAQSITDKLTRALSEPDGGIYDAMNKGLKLARGEFVVFMNSGDRFAGEDVLALVAEHVHPAVNLIYGTSIVEALTTYEKKPIGHRAVAYGMFACHQAMYFRTKIAQSVCYRTTFRISGDYDFVARFLNACGSGAHFLDAPLAIFEVGGRSYTQVAIGRAENRFVQKEVLRLSGWKLFLLQLAYRVTSIVRDQLPMLYALVRAKK